MNSERSLAAATFAERGLHHRPFQRRGLLVLLISGVLCMGGCVLDPDPVLLADPNPARDGRLGTAGPFGAAIIEDRVNVRVTEQARFAVIYPADEAGVPDLSAGPRPAVLVEHGGDVRPERYHWLAIHLATRGYVSILPHHPAELAIFNLGDGLAALDRLRERAAEPDDLLFELVNEDGPAASMGHSLGGVAAVVQWAYTTELDATVLIASRPPGSLDVQARAGSPVLSISGSVDDGTPANIEALAGFAEPRFMMVVDGMTHYDWTDDAEPSELESEAEPGRPFSESRPDALFVIDSFLDASLTGDPDAADRLANEDFPGVEEVER